MSPRLRLRASDDAIDIFVLSAFAFAQPLFDLLSRNTPFFIAHQCRPVDIVLLAVSISLALPALLISIEGCFSLAAPAAKKAVHRTLVALLTGLIFLPALKKMGGAPGMGFSLLVGLGLSLGYSRFRSQRVSLLFLSPAILVFPGLFLFNSPVRRVVFGSDNPLRVRADMHATAPVVMVVFDELPLASLMDESQRIDARLFPNFAALAEAATWYRNATSVSEGTLKAVPSILDGLYPSPNLQLLPNATDHPHNLFTLLGEAYGFHVVETNTRLCPPPLCTDNTGGISFWHRSHNLWSDVSVLYAYLLLPAELTRGLPDVSQTWTNFGDGAGISPANPLRVYESPAGWEDRPGRFKAFVDSIQPSSKPVFHFLHVLLPHAPWEYLPSGKRHTAHPAILRGAVGPNDRGDDPLKWTDEPWAVTQAYQGHLLQVALVDRLVGELLDHLKTVGLFDSSLVVITADHGVSFRLNASRRKLSLANCAEIMAVPLFIKAPYQKEGRVDDRTAETVDILPTLADILGIGLPWEIDGVSLVNSCPLEKKERVFLSEGGRLVFGCSMEDQFRKMCLRAVLQKLQIFGPLRGLEDLHRLGVYRGLIGRPASELAAPHDPAVQCQIEGSYENVDSNGPVLPTNVTGRVIRTRDYQFEPLPLAITINGVVHAVTESYLSGGREWFSALVPESAFRAGSNEVNAVVMRRSNGHSTLFQDAERSGPQNGRETVINLAAEANPRRYQCGGWAEPEPYFSWTNGKKAMIKVPLDRASPAAILQMRLFPYLSPGKFEKRQVRVLANDRLIEEWTLTKAEFHERILFIPTEITQGSENLYITLEIADAVAPASLGDGPDPRELGIAVSWLKLIPSPKRAG